LLHAKIQLREISPVEMLTYDFINLTKTSAELVLNWEKKQFPVKIEFPVDEIVMKNAEQELKGATGFTSIGFSTAANYALANKINYAEALTWIDNALATTRSFANLNIKSGLLQGLNRSAEADKVAKEAYAIATENELNNYGYQLLAGGDKEKAIEVFVINSQKNPASANVWDSLGEGYALKGDKKNAIASFKKSLSMNPPPATKANSEKYLKQLGAM
jgi:tetratricopeptide (TPR) repeat protein